MKETQTMKQFTSEFELKKATKNTFQYKEIGIPPNIGSLYVQKHIIDGEPPKRLKATVEVI